MDIEQIQKIIENFNNGDWAAIGSVTLMVLFSFIQLFSSSKPKKISEVKKEVLEKKDEIKDEVKDVLVSKISWKDRLAKGLSRSKNEVWGKIGNIFSKGNLSEEDLETIEEILYASDMGPAIVDELLEGFKKQSSSSENSIEDFKSWTRNYLESKIKPIQENVDTSLFENTKPGLKVFMIVGVNGAGKTTTIGKLATKLTKSGAKVVVGACDTFRAAAVEQLEVWCHRAGAEMIKAKEGNDPSGVAYDTLARAKSVNADYCLLDTAGRLHTYSNLMDELGKTKRVLKKIDENAPHQTLLVVDSITGQNAIAQAREFDKALSLSGLVLTKCDGSSKAGNAISIVDSLKVPIAYIGVGETVDDLEIFNSDDYLDALL